MSPTNEQPANSIDVMFQAILAFLLPFFLRPTFGDHRAAGTAIIRLVEAYRAATPRELDLAGQIVILSTAATDSLRRSADPNLPDSKVLSYRNSAVSLTRSAARLQKTLDALQKARDPNCPTLRAFDQEPAPAEKPAPTESPKPQAAKPAPAPAAVIPARPARPRCDTPDIANRALEKVQLEAHTAIKALQAQNASLTSVAFPTIVDPAMAATAAAQAAMASARYKAAGPPR